MKHLFSPKPVHVISIRFRNQNTDRQHPPILRSDPGFHQKYRGPDLHRIIYMMKGSGKERPTKFRRMENKTVTGPNRDHETFTEARVDNPSRKVALRTKQDAIKVVDALFQNETTGYCIHSNTDFRKKTSRLKSPNYAGFDVLCHLNTYTSAGWLVCKYYASGCCASKSAVGEFNTSKGGTASLKRHTESHESRKDDARDSMFTKEEKLSKAEKKKIADAAAM